MSNAKRRVANRATKHCNFSEKEISLRSFSLKRNLYDSKDLSDVLVGESHAVAAADTNVNGDSAVGLLSSAVAGDGASASSPKPASSEGCTLGRRLPSGASSSGSGALGGALGGACNNDLVAEVVAEPSA